MRDADRIDTSRPRWPTFRHDRAPRSLGVGLLLLLFVGGCQPGDAGAGAEAGVAKPVRPAPSSKRGELSRRGGPSPPKTRR